MFWIKYIFREPWNQGSLLNQWTFFTCLALVSINVHPNILVKSRNLVKKAHKSVLSPSGPRHALYCTVITWVWLLLCVSAPVYHRSLVSPILFWRPIYRHNSIKHKTKQHIYGKTRQNQLTTCRIPKWYDSIPLRYRENLALYGYFKIYHTI